MHGTTSERRLWPANFRQLRQQRLQRGVHFKRGVLAVAAKSGSMTGSTLLAERWLRAGQ